MRTIALALALPFLVVAPACSGGDASTGADTRPRITTATVVETVEQEPEPSETVDLRVNSGDFGVLAFAEVFIAGKGPYAFTVDTGASHSVVDWDLARDLGLDVIGKPVAVTGITCRGHAGPRRRPRHRGLARLRRAEQVRRRHRRLPGGAALPRLAGLRSKLSCFSAGVRGHA